MYNYSKTNIEPTSNVTQNSIETHSDCAIYVFIWSVSIVLILFGVFITVLYWLWKQKIVEIRRHQEPIVEFINQPANLILLEDNGRGEKCWEMDLSDLQFDHMVGQGTFGCVFRATSKIFPRISVAVKMLREKYSEEDKISLSDEIDIMKNIGKHINIIEIIGCSQRSVDPIFLVMEIAEKGNLRDYLRRFQSVGYNEAGLRGVLSGLENVHINCLSGITNNTLLYYAIQAAQGMCFLECQLVIHRDLAARNILINSHMQLKISDFGMARKLQPGKDYYVMKKRCRLPVKWMAPESLRNFLFSTRSDIWSFGILLWELQTLGGNPYGSLDDIDNLFSQLNMGYRLERPSECPYQLYIIIRQCWQYCPEDRPCFRSVLEHLKGYSEDLIKEKRELET